MKLYDKLEQQRAGGIQIPLLNEDAVDQTFLKQTLPLHLTDAAVVRTLRKFIESSDFSSKRDHHKEQIRKQRNENSQILTAINTI